MNRQLKYLDLVIENNKVPHAFLFYGKCGDQKLEIAKYCVFKINSPSLDRADFKLGEPLAESIIKESHPDVFIARRPEDKKEIPIARIRALRDFVSKTPMNLDSKAAIIDGAEFLSEESWNALLKTIEEPSGNTVIFILSSGLGGIPKTVVSRTVSLPFFGESGRERKQSTKNDIILKKLAPLEVSSPRSSGLATLSRARLLTGLADVGRLTVLDKFDLAEKISASGECVSVLDDWLLNLRLLLLEGQESSVVMSTIEKIIIAKSVLVSTNANQRLVLENLMLEIS